MAITAHMYQHAECPFSVHRYGANAQASRYFPCGSRLDWIPFLQINLIATLSGFIPHANALSHNDTIKVRDRDHGYIYTKVDFATSGYKSRAPPFT